MQSISSAWRFAALMAVGLIPLGCAGPPKPDKLYANLWVETSPEYRAICLQTFSNALRAIREEADAAPRIGGRPVDSSGRVLAVVADLDETILDNSAFNSMLVVEDLSMSEETWTAWVQDPEHRLGLIPGAADFIREVDQLGVEIVFLSNRWESNRPATLRSLMRLGILAEQKPRWILLRTDRRSREKETRRKQVEARHSVIAYLGDNLGDFPGFAEETNEDRRLRVEELRTLWGTRWFVFPNPVYGHWDRELRGKDLRRTLGQWLEDELDTE